MESADEFNVITITTNKYNVITVTAYYLVTYYLVISFPNKFMFEIIINEIIRNV